MERVHFGDLMAAEVQRKKSVLCVGLDPQLRYMPHDLVRAAVHDCGRTYRAIEELFFVFNRAIIDAVGEFAVCVKPQAAFYEAYGAAGIRALERTLDYAAASGLPRITDAKRGDGGDTADAYAQAHIGNVPWFDGADGTDLITRPGPLQTDAVTIHGWIGEDCVSRFVKEAKEYGTGVFVVDKTSFKPNSQIEQLETNSGLHVWQELAEMVRFWGEGTEGALGYRNVGVVLGATYPEDAPWMRQTLPDSWFLVPGYGGQGGTAEAAVSGADTEGLGVLVNSSRGITYAYRSDRYRHHDKKHWADAARQAARDARDELNLALASR